MAQEQVRVTAGGAILCDPAVASQVDDDWFMPSHWRELGALRMQTGGRGGVALVGTPVGEGVLRHYRRGGMVARFMGDRYVWTGAERTRSFAEFRLLAAMAREGLPVPLPIAAPGAASTPDWPSAPANWSRASIVPACGMPTSTRTTSWSPSRGCT
jgi:3-deoxy-D-manno-octulosonic acid kinase